MSQYADLPEEERACAMRLVGWHADTMAERATDPDHDWLKREMYATVASCLRALGKQIEDGEHVRFFSGPTGDDVTTKGEG
ncbi:MAG: hypothetical protein K0S42_3067 [Microvirga sp.]|nr:hypothetical protein [Microvirga sp.]